MKNLKKVLVVAMSMAIIFAFSACGQTETYKAVTEPTFPPFDTTDEDGNIVGFDMDLMNAIAEDQGFAVEYTALEFDALIPALQSDQGDIITAGMNAEDPERQAKVDFSTTYYDSGLVCMVRADEKKIKGIDSLGKDNKVASQIGTTGADEVNRLADDGKIDEAVIIQKFDTCVMMLQTGDVDAIIIDKPVAEAFIKKDEKGSVKIVGETLNAESYGFAVKKGNTELLEKINTGLQNCIDNGTYDELYTKWFEDGGEE